MGVIVYSIDSSITMHFYTAIFLLLRSRTWPIEVGSLNVLLTTQPWRCNAAPRLSEPLSAHFLLLSDKYPLTSRSALTLRWTSNPTSTPPSVKSHIMVSNTQNPCSLPTDLNLISLQAGYTSPFGPKWAQSPASSETETPYDHDCRMRPQLNIAGFPLKSLVPLYAVSLPYLVNRH